jgi:hypothetical protein
VRRAATLLAALLLAGCDFGPLGGTALRGVPASDPVNDWSFLEPRYGLAIETHAPSWLPSAQAWFVVQDGVLWIYAISTPQLERPWVQRLRDEDPGVTIEVDGKLHQGKAVHVTDPAILEPLLPRVLRKYHGVETTRARFAPRSERFPDTQVRHAFFRIDPVAKEAAAK